MSLRVSDLARLEAANRALLSPLDYDDPSAWSSSVVEVVRDLLGADNALMVLPGAVLVEGPGTPPTFRQAYEREFERALRGEPTEDPLVFEFVRRRREAAIDVVDFDAVDRLLGGRIHCSSFHQDAFVAGGIRDMHALYVDVLDGGRPGELAFTAGFERPLQRGRGERGLALLRVLKPAFMVGIEVCSRLSARREALVRALDDLGLALAVVDLAGRTMHQTRPLTGLLGGEPERERLAAAVRAVALGAAWAHAARNVGGEPPPPPALDVTTARGRYRVRATSAGEGVFGPDPAALVLIEIAPAPPPPEGALAERFGLTRQEVRVAALLAARKTTGEVAEALCISPNTARRHTEHVLAKLGVRSRKDVAAALAG